MYARAWLQSSLVHIKIFLSALQELSSNTYYLIMILYAFLWEIAISYLICTLFRLTQLWLQLRKYFLQ
jgi:hypothetical protein